MAGRRRRRTVERERELADLLARGSSEHYVDPLLYDSEYADQADDVDWYTALADERARGGKLLELGVGSGRIAIPIAQAGHHVIGLDRMQTMLDHLHAKLRALERAGEPVRGPIETTLGEMTDIPLPDACVELVIAPFNCLMHLYTWQDLLACFRGVFRVLKPGGSFGFDVLLPDLEWLLLDPDQRHAVTRFTHPRTGERMIYSTNHNYDPDTQVCHIRLFYDEGTRLRPNTPPREVVQLAHRQIFPEEIRALLSWAGFEIESQTGDFLDLQLTRDVEVQVVVARKPG
ncbi:class I SAM-dependent methyltransferase [Nannocystaceae bacterium ST9]